MVARAAVRTCIIFNPTARGERARSFLSRAGELGATLKPTAGPETAPALAAEAVREGFDVIVAAGGDGTVNEVLNGLAREANGLASARLGILPLGTANVFARELGIPLNMTGAWKTIRDAPERRVDLPFAEFRTDAPVRRFFAQLAGAGLDSRAVELVDWTLKKRLGYFAYIIAGLRAIRTRMPPITATAGDRTACGELVMIGNGRLYGGSFNFFPAADLEDGVLEVIVYPRVTLFTVIRTLRGIITGDFHSGGRTVQMRAPSVAVECAEAVRFQLDGENVGRLPARFGVLPRALRVIAPQKLSLPRS